MTETVIGQKFGGLRLHLTKQLCSYFRPNSATFAAASNTVPLNYIDSIKPPPSRRMGPNRVFTSSCLLTNRPPPSNKSHGGYLAQYNAGVAPGIFGQGADSSDEGAKILLPGYCKCQNSPKT